MVDGVIRFVRPESCEQRKFIRTMTVKRFGVGENLLDVDTQAEALGVTS